MRVPSYYEAFSDEELMEFYYECDPMAFDELWRRYRGRLMGYLRECAPCASSSLEDVFQEVWIRICETKHRGKGRFDPSKGKFKTWLFQCARNKAIDACRKRRREQPFSSLDEEMGRAEVEIV